MKYLAETKYSLCLFVIFTFIFLSSGCHQGQSIARMPSDKIHIVATTGMIADIATIVGGDRVEVDCLMGPGIDPHRYIPTAGDLKRLQNADMIFFNGLHLEGKMSDVFAQLGDSILTSPVSAQVPDHLLRKLNDGEEVDPHIWFDVSLWKYAVMEVRDKLILYDPSSKQLYEEKASNYLQELSNLHQEIWDKIHSIHENKRVLITSHDAFAYFGRAYEITVRGLQGVSTAADTGSQDVRLLAAEIGQKKIPVIFGETSVPDRGIRAVQETVFKDWNWKVSLSKEKLYSDALGEVGTSASTYTGMVRHNLSVILKELNPTVSKEIFSK